MLQGFFISAGQPRDFSEGILRIGFVGKQFGISLHAIEGPVEISGLRIAVGNFIPGIGKIRIDANGSLKKWNGLDRLLLIQNQPPSRQPGNMLIVRIALQRFIHRLNGRQPQTLAGIGWHTAAWPEPSLFPQPARPGRAKRR